MTTPDATPAAAPRHARASSARVRRNRVALVVAFVAVLVGVVYLLRGPVLGLRGTRVEVRAGQSAETVAAHVVKATGWDPAAVAAAFSDPSAAGVPGGAASIEGWLAPDVYDVPAKDTPAALVAEMVARRRAQVSSLGLEAAASAQHRTVADLITIASVAQAEAIPSQYGQVARVVTNRLAAQMPLQMDATLNYAKKTHELAHNAKDLTDPSLFNSYNRQGLPPTPIGNPDERALVAAASPPTGPWLYFVLTNHDGTQLFTANYDEFLKAKAKAKADGLF